MTEIVVIAHDIRSTHNVGALLRTCEGLGISRLYITGFTPYPEHDGDQRLPHLTRKISANIHKTALGAEDLLSWEYSPDVSVVLDSLNSAGYEIVGLEQSSHAVSLPDYQPANKVALLLGREVEGIDDQLLIKCHKIIEIPMFGQKESFNVVEAATMALYHLRFNH